MLDFKHQLLFDEIKENDRQAGVPQTITGLNIAGFLLARIAKGDEEGDRSMAIDGLYAVVSVMAYVSLMHSTVDSIKGKTGGDVCA